ncbi:MAG: hypothetical protein ACRDNR_07415 [Gaiellaceae bacterium]
MLALIASCSPGSDKEAELPSAPAANADHLRTFTERGVSFRYPRDWSVAGFSTTVSPARVAIASYPLDADAVEGDCGGWAAVEALPPEGALVIIIDYGEAARFAARPARFRLADGEYANYECFGASIMFRFQAGGRALQAHVAIGHDAGTSLSREALAVLDSVVVEGDGGRAAPLIDLALHPNRYVGKRVVVEGQLYKFPGNRISSAKVQDQLVCDRIDRFPPGGSGTYCIAFWGVRVQDVDRARRSPDGGWWVRLPVRLAGRLHGFPYPEAPAERVALAATAWQSAPRR